MTPAAHHRIRDRRHAADHSADLGTPTVDAIDPMRVRIGDVMTRSVVCVFDDFSVEALEELLLERELSGVPVLDDNGLLVGFAAMKDIVRELHDRANTSEVFLDGGYAWGYHEQPQPRTVADVMTPIVLELHESCSVTKAVELMTLHRVHRLPVVSNDGELVGIVTAGDIVHFLGRMQRRASGSAETAAASPDVGAEVPRERQNEADRLLALGFLAGGVAHEFNNALTPMRLSLGRLTSFELSRRPFSAERLHRIELLQDVREGVERVERIIHELKAFSHSDGVSSRPVELSNLLDVAVGLTAHEIRHRARLVCDYRKVPAVHARPAELRQVFLNLLVNAAQAIPEGNAHVNEIRVTTRTDDRGRAIVEIEDSGSGIPSDMLPRIYEPFFTGRSEPRGLGLGLAMARDVVSALDGEIEIDSVVGKGTTVRVKLPPCDQAAAAAPAEPSHHNPKPGERQRILIIDDDRPVAAAIALVLDANDVVVAESGREALEILKRDKNFDVILCDLMMPEVSGMDVYEALRLIDPSLLGRVVMMTGGAFTARASQFLSEIESPLIEKPFEPGQLQAVLSAVGRRRERELGDPRITEPDVEPWRPSDLHLSKERSSDDVHRDQPGQIEDPDGIRT